jgi:hypothetical protein
MKEQIIKILKIPSNEIDMAMIKTFNKTVRIEGSYHPKQGYYKTYIGNNTQEIKSNLDTCKSSKTFRVPANMKDNMLNSFMPSDLSILTSIIKPIFNKK